MNDDLYGHDLEAGEKVVFVGPTSPEPVREVAILAAMVFIMAPTLWRLLDNWPFMAALRPDSKLQIALLLFLLGISAMGFLNRLFQSTRPTPKKARPALLTTHRVIAPNGHSLPLSRISSVRTRFSATILEGQKLADGMTIGNMQNARAFRTAIERSLA